MKAFHRTVPASPAAALPTVTFDRTMRLYHNGDEIALDYFGRAHTDTDISIYFHKADVLHVGDIWFNGMYPFIDEGTGGNIGGMIRATDKALAIAGANTKIIPGHGPLGGKDELAKYRFMLEAIRAKVAALKAAGRSEEEAIAQKPTAEFDSLWGKGMMSPADFTGIVYRTL
jgi:glyoxylase-like metal-dependent hydrolase (beta-lactamase superfamily II)